MLQGPKPRGTIDFGWFLSLCENETLLILKACILPGSQTWQYLNCNLFEKDIQIKFIKCSKVTPNTFVAHLTFNILGLMNLQHPPPHHHTDQRKQTLFALRLCSGIDCFTPLLIAEQLASPRHRELILILPADCGLELLCPTECEQK